MYRQEAVEARNKQWSGKALLLSGISSRMVMLFTVIFFFCFLSLIILGSYTRRINVSGEIISSPRAITVFSAQQGFVVSQLVRPGEKVKKGQAIYQIDVSRTTTSGVVSKNRRRNIENQIAVLNNIADKIRQNKKTILETLNRERASYEAALQHSSEILNTAQKGLSMMKQNMDNYRSYQRRGLINKDQLISQTALYYQQHNDLLGLRSQNEQNALQILVLQSNLQTQSVDFDNQLNQLEMQKNALTGELTDADASSDLIVTSPVDGWVDTLSVSPGQMVTTGDSLLQIIPGETRQYELVLWIPDSAVPYLSPGEAINIRYDAFPAEKFGQFPGKILSIARTPASQQEMATYPGAPFRAAEKPQTWYKLVVTPDATHFYYKGRWMGSENGMKATSTLFLEERKLYQWILSPLYDIRNSIRGVASDK
ncbi:HlyD family secretion protein [Erwinia oleae]|uniref:HlyD family secretion protein n=1 Tax=Erwinia oleae TaxID=796334 RepID=UPI000550D8EE|nr:HlyD family secretion protein [Erwinia oleae]